ncbi:homeobox protein knotted-1-like 1 isoform X1 [Vitis vinifera]|uniref:homeobox protein knotted-1-like 1 isoform X1 n=1 Tax=Vitis vinifera TaxID=29760 RepID=UPI00053FA189|nr:homeobox protein knotted-1-like 1 isoform X1 [Vitis vinifera]|eukprot:XP_010663717.1 PREDICTED: homeobox protein knotted-1-like 1 isoform X1 [Vitis vinifera]
MHAYMGQLVTAKDGEAVLYCGFILFVCTPLYSFMAMGCNKKCSTHERRDLEGFVFLSRDMEGDGSSDENGERVSGGGGRLEEEEERKMLKRRISCHPLYGFLVEAHLDCLKVGLGSNDGKPGKSHKSDEKKRHNQPSLSMYSQSELDHFMEAYCTTLTKLKEAMEEPQQETLAFINSMQSQLEELSGSQHEPPQPPTISSGKLKLTLV